MSVPLFLEKAQESLTSAKLSLESECPNSTANRAYYAVFHASRAALVAAGECRVEERLAHDRMQAAFAKLVVRRKLYPASLKGTASRLVQHREIADYGLSMVSLKAAKEAVRTAEEFVSAVEEKIGR